MRHKYVVAILRRLASFGVKRMNAPQICCCNFAKVDKSCCDANECATNMRNVASFGVK